MRSDWFTDRATTGRVLGRRAALALLLLLSLAILLGTSGAAPEPENPHGAFREDCSLCHGARGWKPARVSRRFNHAKYGFALEGAHAATDCLACHASLEFKRPEKRCASCHEDPHRGEMGAECARCHGSRSFLDRATMLRAHQLSHFPLTGSHAGLECEMCHQPAEQGRLRFVATQAECRACHLDSYQAVRDPDHAASGFSLECQICHTTMRWQGARFDHGTTAFPLTGAHRQAACASCHGDGVWAGKSTACVSCHQTDYDGTTDPSHAAAGFPTTCQSCHNTSGWSGANFLHDANFFPIYSGAHAGKWSSCATCHTNNANYAQFSCFGCHPHDDQPKTDEKHSGTPGYSYDSQACYSCHPRGRH
jgi:Zn finger protein HypA/HybF involved in hydrogenase expression